MKLLVDSLDSTTGWVGAGGASIPSTNEITEFIAGLNTKSLVLKWGSGSSGGTVTKTINPAVDVSDYREIVFHLWSREKKRAGMDYRLSSDFVYKIDFGSGDEFYLPTFSGFTDVTFDISGIDSISRIRITALHDDEDYLIVSNMFAIYDEIPRDIFDGIKDSMEQDISNFYSKIIGGTSGKGIFIGNASGNTGDRLIQINSSLPFAEKYAVILIDDGVNSETHQIGGTDKVDYTFNSMYDGETLQNTYTDANVYITFPVLIGTRNKEIVLPGISIWGMAPEEIIRGNKEDESRDTFNIDETVKSRITPANFVYDIRIDCEARSDELLAYMSNIVRSLIAKEFVWINGKRIDISPEGPALHIEPAEGFNQIPKITYRVSIEIKEELFDRTTLVRTITNNRTVSILS